MRKIINDGVEASKFKSLKFLYLSLNPIIDSFSHVSCDVASNCAVRNLVMMTLLVLRVKLLIGTKTKDVVYILFSLVLALSPEPKAHGELIGWYSSRRPSVRPPTFSKKNKKTKKPEIL